MVASLAEPRRSMPLHLVTAPGYGIAVRFYIFATGEMY